MLETKVEQWAGHAIRFINAGGECEAVLKDVAEAMGYRMASDAARLVPEKFKGTQKVRTNKGPREVTTVKEPGLYGMFARSRKPEAKQFQEWTYKVIQELRKQSGLADYEAFRLLDKQVQRDAMKRLKASSPVDYIKANTITNKAIANAYGLPKMIKKREMGPDMLKDRAQIQRDVVELMNVKQRYGLDISVANTIYKGLPDRHQSQRKGAGTNGRAIN